MTAPIETGPVGRQALLDQLAITDQDEKTIDGVIAAVNAQVILWKGAHDPWAANYVHGAVMLASRIVRRRNSPAGIETFSMDATAYVQRNDPDVQMFLELGPWTRPAVG
ncbi:hypothetical protein G8767_33460 [Rhodococcus sp. IC4_135]|uniref:hypothetical protein n=1 Tax=Rhodococcus sp. IC4_135 TaxID=2715537 RepID=UPI00141E6926|nr:hypothetical protein [Rhodococcus sp. IC4_135]